MEKNFRETSKNRSRRFDGLESSRAKLRRNSPLRALLVALIPCAVCLVMLSHVSAARAQTADELSEARVKFQQAIELEQAQNWAGALRLFRDVAQVKMTPQIRYHIAVCEENLGQLVTALGGYELALEQSEGMHPDFIAEVRGSVEELSAKIPKLVILRGEGADAAAVELDGVAIGDAQVGVEIPLNPGPHAVVATAPGFKRFQHTVTVEEGAVSTLTIVLEPKKKAEPTTVTPEEPKGFGLTPYIVGGSGLGVMVIGGVLLGVSQGKAAKLKKMCGGDTDCSELSGQELQDGYDLRDSARALETAGWVTTSLGVAALATGTVLYFLDKRNKREQVAGGLRFVPAAPRSDAGFSLHATF